MQGTILVIAILISAVLLLISRLIWLTYQRNQSLASINQNLKKEIADRAHAEETKQKLEKALLQGQKLQAIGTLAGGIAHDFNNILYAIIGYVEMAREDISQDTITYSNLGKVLEAACRGQELIARILAFSRRHHPELKPLCLKETLESVLALLKPTIPASVLIQFNVKLSSECYILGNQTQLHQVIVNIINNAVDAMDGEGTVTMNLSRVSTDDPLLQELSSNTHYCKIDITDTGHGIDHHTLERIFEPFFTTKEVGKGTGLGLSTVHAIMEEHQGKVLATSQLGRGATFTLLLPEYVTKEKEDGKNTVSGR